MRYYKHDSEDIKLGAGFIFQEIDEKRDLVVRQVSIFGDTYFMGEWTGKSLVGFICDQKASILSLQPEEAITKDEFEQEWRQAKEKTNGR